MLSRLARLSWRDRLLLVEATAWLAVARVAVRVLPFRVLAKRLGAHMAESPSTEAPRTVRIGRISWAIGTAAGRTPWRSMCLEQGLAAKAMLRTRGVPNTLYLGVARGPDDRDRALTAHAWLRSGTVNVTGGAEVDGYAVVSTYADGPSAPSRETMRA